MVCGLQQIFQTTDMPFQICLQTAIWLTTRIPLSCELTMSVNMTLELKVKRTHNLL